MSFMKSSRNLWVQKCNLLKKELNQAQAGMQCLQKNTAELSLPSKIALNTSADREGSIIRTANLKGKHMKRKEPQKQLLLKDFPVDLA